MSSNWKTLTLAEVCEKITDGAHQSPKSVENGKPMASVKDLTRFGVDLSNARKISQEDFEDLVLQGCKPKVGDILIAKDGNSALDTVCTVDVPLDAVLLSSVAILRPDPKKLESDFLKYYFCSPKIIDYLKTNFISGAAIPRVVLRDFRKAKINIPALDVQKQISQCLRSLDDRILNNLKTNQTLEAMEQAIFKSWFVDFDPVKAKMRGERPVGMDDATAALFPGTLVESELGLIPEGWELKQLKDILELAYGKAMKKTDRIEGNVPVYGSGGLTGSHNEYLVAGPGIIIGRKGTVGSIYWEPKNFYPIDTVFYVKPNKEYSLNYCHLVLQNLGLKDMNTDAAVPGLNRNNAYRLDVVIPCEKIRAKFETLISSLQTKIDTNNSQNASLESLRDTLLPKLLSGEIDLSNINTLTEVME